MAGVITNIVDKGKGRSGISRILGRLCINIQY